VNVLVTGGAGFIGSHIVDLLIKEGHNVFIIDNLSTGKINNINRDARFYNDSITNDISYIFDNGIDVVIHQAAQTSVYASMQNILYDHEINIYGTLNLLNICKKYNVKKFIYASSAAIYGTPQYLPIDEKHAISPESYYGLSKYTAERYVELFAKSNDMKYIILRYSNVFGPRQDPYGEGGVIAIFSERMIKDKEVIIFGDGEQTRDFVYVEDVASANICALASEVSGVFNISNNNSISINELFKIMSEIANYKRQPVYHKERLGDIKHSCLSNKKMIELMNWKPRVNLIEGLMKTFDFFTKQKYV